MTDRVLVAFLLVPFVAWGLCGPGAPGHDSKDFDIAVVHNTVTGCTTQTLPGLAFPVILCNGTNEAECPAPVISTTGLPRGCGSVTGVGSVTFCNSTTGAAGATGAAGLKGASGAQGPLLTITASPIPTCQIVSNGAGVSVTLCNGTSNVTGATGAQGLQGAAGTNGAVGATGPQGIPGFHGILPNYYIFDGIAGYTQTSLNTALQAVSVLGGGVLYLGPCDTFSPSGSCVAPGTNVLVSDCQAPIVIPDNVILDLGGDQIQMAAGNVKCAPLIQTGSSTTPSTAIATNLIANSTVGSNTVTIASSIAIGNALAAGQVCILIGGWPPGYAFPTASSFQTTPLIEQIVRIASFVNATGVITFRKPLIGNFGTGPAPFFNTFLQCFTSTSKNAGLRNGYISFGSNSHAQSQAVNVGQASGSISHFVSDITFTGPASGTNQIIFASTAVDLRLENINQDSAGAPVTVSVATGTTIRNVHLSNCGLGVYLAAVVYSTVQDITMETTSATAMTLQDSPFNAFKNIQIENCAVSGLEVAGAAYRNTFQDVIVTGSRGYGICLGSVAGTPQIGTGFNQFYGAVLRNNALGSVQLGLVGEFTTSTTVGNYIDGDIEGSIKNVAPGGNGTDAAIGNMLRQTTNSNGFMATALHSATVATTDFPANRMLIFSGDDLNLKLNYLSSTGTLKTSATIGLS